MSAFFTSVFRFVAVRIWVLGISITALHAGSSSATAETVNNPPADGSHFIGMHIHRPVQAPWPAFEFAGWRLLDAGVSWRAVQPTKETFDFNRLDVWARMAEVKGVDITYVFYATPAWASARPDEAGANGSGSAAEPRNIDDWRRFVRTVVTRYKGRIKFYEVWNEPNWKNFYTGTWPQLAELVRETAQILREVDPNAKLILPGLASEHGLTVIDEFLRTGVGNSVDIIGYHFYTGHRPPEVVIAMISKLRASLVKASLESKPIWNTEFGWLIEGQGRKISPAAAGFASKDPVYSDDVAASFMMRMVILMVSAGIQRSYFYAWDNESMGVYDPIAKSIKPALAAAFPTLVRWLRNGVELCTQQSNEIVCKLPNTEAALVWSSQGVLDLNRLASSWSTYEDNTGVVRTLSARMNPASFGTGPYLLRK